MKTPLSLLCAFLVFSASSRGEDTLHLDLNTCISRAKKDGAAARVLRMEYASQCMDHDAARAEYLPQIRLSANLPGYSRAIVPVLQPDGSIRNVSQTQTYSDASLNLIQRIPFTGGTMNISSSLNNRVNLSSERTDFWQASPINIQLNQPLFGVNYYGYSRQAEQLRFEQASRAYVEQMEDIAIQASGRFFDYYIACMNVENAELNIAINDSIYVLAKGRYNFGKIAENDLLQNELAVLSAQSDYERARLLRQRSHAALCLSLGISDERQIAVLPPLLLPAMHINVKEALESALARRSEITSFESQRLESERLVSQARTNNRFQASISAGYGLNQSGVKFGDAYRNPVDQERLSLNVELPLVSWGQTSSLVESSLTQQQRVETQGQLRLKELEQDVNFEVKDFLQLAQLVRISEKSQQIAARRYEVARNRYIIGKIETTELMLSQREKDDARRSFYSTLRDYWTAYYRIRKLTLYDFETGQPILPDTDN